MIKTVITFGTFDLMHKGHINILERASKLGNKLIVGISTDELNYKKKKKNSIYNQSDRQKLISSLKFVDDTFFEESLELKRKYILEHKADILCMGNDWEGRFDEFKDICQVIYLPRTKDISTTEIVADVIQRNLINYICLSKNDAQNLYDILEDLIFILNKYNIEYFAIGKTLLGAVRNKCLIPWNFDIDLAIFDNNSDLLEFYMFKKELENKECSLKKVETGYIVRRKNYNINIYLMEYIKDNKITFSSDIAKKIWPKRIINKNNLYPLKKYTFGPLEINGLNDPHDFFIACDFGQNYMNEGKIIQNYYSKKYNVVVNFLIEKELNIVKEPGLLYKKI